MKSLQQISFLNIDPSSSEHELGDIVSHHRYSNSILVKRGSVFYGYRQEFSTWTQTGLWSIPDDDPAYSILVACISLESLSGFLLIFSAVKTSHAVFLDLDGQALNSIHLSQTISCADVDHQRKELVMGLSGGKIVSYAIRSSTKKTLTEGSKPNSREFLLLLRKYTLVSSPDFGKSSMQIACSDIGEFSVILMKRGGLICIDTGTLDLLWQVEPSRFLYPPRRIWVDRFGSDFIVHCREKIEGDSDGEREIVEIWTLPTSLAMCDANQFGRVLLPTNGPLLCVAIENINFDRLNPCVMIAVVSTNLSLQLWHRSREEIFTMKSELALRRPLTDLRQYFERNTECSCPFPAFCNFEDSPSFLGNESNISLLMFSGTDVCTVSIYSEYPSSHKYQEMVEDIISAERALEEKQFRQQLREMRTQAVTKARTVPPSADLEGGKHVVSREASPKSSTSRKFSFGVLAEAPSDNANLTHERSGGELKTSSQFRMNLSSRMDDSGDEDEEEQGVQHDAKTAMTNIATATATTATTATTTAAITVEVVKTKGTVTAKQPLHLAPPDLTSPQAPVVAPPAVEAPSSARKIRGQLPLEEISSSVGCDSPKAAERLSPSQQSSRVICPSLDAPLVPNSNNVQLPMFSSCLGVENPKTLSFIPIQLFEQFPFAPQSAHSLQNELDGGHYSIGSDQNFMKFSVPPAMLAASYVTSQQGKTEDSSSDDFMLHGRGAKPVAGGYFESLNLITPQGLLPAASARDIDPMSHLMSYSLISVAYRFGAVGVVSTLKECFLVDIGVAAGKPDPIFRPIKVPIELSSTTQPTAMLLCDVQLQISPERSGPLALATTGFNAIDGQYLLSLVGDSVGNINFTLLSKDALVSAGILKAHTSPVVAILSTGDSMRPLWRVGTKQIFPEAGSTPAQSSTSSLSAMKTKPVASAKTRGKATSTSSPAGSYFVPVAIPGSAIVTVARDGEIKVWQPSFVSTNSLQSKRNQILNVFEIRWKVSGMMSCWKPRTEVSPRRRLTVEERIQRKLTKLKPSTPSLDEIGAKNVSQAVLDPTCMTIFVCFENGKIDQWIVPGLVHSPNSSLSTSLDSMWTSKQHLGNIKDFRLWVHLSDTSVNEIQVEDTPEAAASGKLSQGRSGVRYAASAQAVSLLGTSVGYTLLKMKQFADISTLVSCATDSSLILWKFVLSTEPKKIEGNVELDMNVYLHPSPVRRLTFSSIPRAGLCSSRWRFDFSPSALWRIHAIIDGELLTVLEMERDQILSCDSSVGTVRADNFLNAVVTSSIDQNSQMAVDLLNLGSQVTAGSSSQYKSMELSVSAEDRSFVLHSMPVAANVLKPLRVLDIVTKCERPIRCNTATVHSAGVGAARSWTLFKVWTDRVINPYADFDDTETAAGGVFVGDSTRPASPVEALRFYKPGKKKNFVVSNKRVVTATANIPPRTPHAMMEGKIEDGDLPPSPEKICSPDGREKVVKHGVHLGLTDEDQEKVEIMFEKRYVIEKPKGLMDQVQEMTDDVSESTRGSPQPSVVAESSSQSFIQLVINNARMGPRSPSPSSHKDRDRSTPVLDTGSIGSLDSDTIASHRNTVMALNLERYDGAESPHAPFVHSSRELNIDPLPLHRQDTTETLQSGVNPLSAKLSLGSFSPKSGKSKDAGAFKSLPFTLAEGTTESTTGSRQTRAAEIRREAQLKELQRKIMTERKKEKRIVYTSKSSIGKTVNQLNKGVRQVMGNVATIALPKNFSDNKLMASIDRVVIDRNRYADKPTELPLPEKIEIPSVPDVIKAAAAGDEFTDDFDDSELNSVQEDPKVEDYFAGDDNEVGHPLSHHKSMRLAVLGVVFGGIDLSQPLAQRETHRTEEDVEKIAHSVQGIQKTTEFAGTPYYFNRSAKAIVMRRSPPQIKRLVSKRFQSNNLGFPADEDGEESEESSVAEAAILEMLMSDNHDDMASELLKRIPLNYREIFDDMPEEEKKEIMQNSLFVKGRRATLRTATHVLIQALRVAGNKFNLAVELKEISLSCMIGPTRTVSSVSVMISTEDSGRILVLLLQGTGNTASCPNTNELKSFDNNVDAFLSAHEDVLQMRVLFFELGAPAETIVFENLSPDTQYCVATYIDGNFKDTEAVSTRKLYHHMTEESFERTFLDVTTLSETLDIEWGRLSHEQRCSEIAAACRYRAIQNAAECNFPVISIPTTEEIERFTKNPNDQSQSLEAFLAWWTEGDPHDGFGKTRKKFLFDECIFAAQDDQTLSSFRSDSVTIVASQINELREWAAMTPAHLAFLASSDDGESDDASVASARSNPSSSRKGKLSRKQSRNSGKSPQTPGRFGRQSSLMSRQNSLLSEEGGRGMTEASHLEYGLFKRFRSWYKGGYAMVQILKDTKALRGSGSVSSKDSGRSHDLKELISWRLRDRAKLLDHRRRLVEDAIKLAEGLVNSYIRASEERLSEEDLFMRRSQLSEEEVNVIMASSKLMDLFRERELMSVTGKMPELRKIGTGKYSLQIISGADLFTEINPATLKPKDAPVFERAVIAGTNRRPLKPWQLCTEEEKTMELSLACSLDSIQILAIEQGISIPDPEDVLLDPKNFNARFQRWTIFAKWYAGAEEKEKVPGRGIPTVARTVVAEEWEGPAIERDAVVFDHLVQLGFHRPIAFQSSMNNDDDEEVDEAHLLKLEEEKLRKFTELREQAINPEPVITYDPTDTEEVISTSRSAVTLSSTLNSARSQSSAMSKRRDGSSNFLDIYEGRISLPAGIKMRFDLLTRYLDVILSCRRVDMLRLVCPPGPFRAGHQFMFPSSGLVLPPLEFPPKRYKLFPSRSNQCYTVKEILKWYTSAELDGDDVKLQKAEADGQRHRLYLEWLAKESERQEESRMMMAEEDHLSRLRCRYWQELESKIAAAQEERRLRSLQAKMTTIQMGPAIPTDLSFLRGDDPRYAFGSGVDNDDEMEDFKEQLRVKQEKLKEEERLLKLRLAEERQRKEKEELARLKREEQDRRLEEGMEKRRHARERFDELKAKRIQEELEAAELLAQQKEAEEQERVVREMELFAQELRRKEVDRRNYENKCMEAEELRTREQLTIVREATAMEREEYLSVLREGFDTQVDLFVRERKQYLQEIYQPYIPFEFVPKTVRLPALNKILTESDEYFRYDFTSNIDAEEAALDRFEQDRQDFLISSTFSRSLSSRELALSDERSSTSDARAVLSMLRARNSSPPRSDLAVENKSLSSESKVVTSLEIPDAINKDEVEGPSPLQKNPRISAKGGTFKRAPGSYRDTPAALSRSNSRLSVATSGSDFSGPISPAASKTKIRKRNSHKDVNYVDNFLSEVATGSTNAAGASASRSSEEQSLSGKLYSSSSLPSLSGKRQVPVLAKLALQDSRKAELLDFDKETEEEKKFAEKEFKALLSTSTKSVLPRFKEIETILRKTTQHALAMSSLASLQAGGGSLLQFNEGEPQRVSGLGPRKTGPKKKTSAYYAKAFGERDFQDRLAQKMRSSSPPKSPSSRSFNWADLGDFGDIPASALPESFGNALLTDEERDQLVRSASMSGWRRLQSLRERAEKMVVPVQNGIPRPDLLPLARAAAEVVQKIKTERESMREYVDAGAVQQDKFFLEAIRPGLRSAPSLESETTLNFSPGKIGNLSSRMEFIATLPCVEAMEEIAGEFRPLSTGRELSASEFTKHELNVCAEAEDEDVEESDNQLLQSDLQDQNRAISKMLEVQQDEKVKFPEKELVDPVARAKQRIRQQRRKQLQQQEVPKPDFRQVDYKPPFYRGSFGVKGAKAEIAQVPLSQLTEFKAGRFRGSILSSMTESTSGICEGETLSSDGVEGADPGNAPRAPHLATIVEERSSFLQESSDLQHQLSLDRSGPLIGSDNKINDSIYSEGSSQQRVRPDTGRTDFSQDSNTILTSPPVLPLLPVVKIKKT